MKETVSVAQAATAQEAVLPARVQEALGELVGRGEGGAAGAERRRRARRAGRADGGGGRRGRRARRASTTRSAPRCVTATRPARSRSAAGASRSSGRGCGPPTAQRGAACDLRALRRPRPADPGGAGADARRRLDAPLSRARGSRSARTVERGARSTSKSAVSREFVARTREHLGALMSRRLDDVRLAVLMLDGIELKGRY